MVSLEEPAAPAPAKRRGGRLLLWSGLVLILAGLVLLGYVGWQLWGTNYLSQQRQEQAVTEIHDAWESGESVVATDWGDADAIIRIPRFGDDYSIPVFEGIGDEVLAAGYGHFSETAKPGQIGNYALAAHRVTHGEPLRDMPELQVGDEVIVETRRMTFTYELVTGGDDLIVDFHDIWVTDPVPTNPDGGVQPPQGDKQRLLTLTTCSELFHTDNRMIAFAKLVDKAPRA